MRPVNLIPPEERRGESAPLRAGAASYVVIAALVLILGAVTAVVLTNNKIADREAEKSSLEAERQQAQQRVAALAPYSQFASMSEARRQTVTSLAQSRFDWERVLRELAIVLPDDVWLTELTGTVSPDTQLAAGASVDGRDEVAGPALEIIGCATGQPAVARFLAALRNIDGVTRVGLGESQRPESGDSIAGGSGGATGTSDECRTRDYITKFTAIAAFDAVPAPASAAPVAPDSSATSTSTTDSSTTESSTTETTASTDVGGGG